MVRVPAENLENVGKVRIAEVNEPCFITPCPINMNSPIPPHYPDFDVFVKLAGDAHLVPVYRRISSDALTPVTAFHKIDAGRCACLFESVVGGEKVGRYSFLATEPFFEIEAYGRRVTTNAYSAVSAGGAPTLVTRQFECNNPLEELRRRVEAVKAVHLPELPPFCGGAVGYAGYDTVRYYEHLPQVPADDRQLPDMAFSFYDQMVIFDHVTKTIDVVAMARLDKFGSNHEKAYQDACLRVDRLVQELSDRPCNLNPFDIPATGQVSIPYESNFTQADFEKAVRKCVEYIRAGDIFQVVFSQRLKVPIQAHPFEIYRTLRVVNPSPFMFYVRTPSATLVGSSPEVMVRVVDRQVTVRPLAGTRRRGATEEEDARLAEELLADPKERAEHVMLVDLGRNDVGRVCEYRTVNVSDVMTIERYSHVMHITSNVSGQLAPGKSAFDCAASLFAGGHRFRQRRRFAPCRSSMRSSPTAAAPTPARWATSISTAIWTPASRCGRSSFTTARLMSRPAPASSPTACPRTSGTKP